MSSITPPSITSLPCRARSSSDSRTCARRLMGMRFRKPAPPLNVWNARKTVLSVSVFCGLFSSTSTPCSMLSRCARDSLMNSRSSSASSARFSSMGGVSASISAGGDVSVFGGALTDAVGAAGGGQPRTSPASADTRVSKSFNHKISFVKNGFPDSTICTSRSHAAPQSFSSSWRFAFAAASRRLPMRSRMGNWPDGSSARAPAISTDNCAVSLEIFSLIKSL